MARSLSGPIARRRPPRPRRPSEDLDAPAQRFRWGDADGALALAFAIGGVQGLLILAGAHWYVARPQVIVALSLAAVASAAAILVLRRHLRTWSRHVLIGTGSLLVSVAVWACGPNPSTMSLGYLYALIALYAAAFFSARGVALQLAGIGISYGAALALRPTPAGPVQWAQAMALLGVIAVLVASFAQELRRTAAVRAYALVHDPLTGLGNRAQFLDQLDAALNDGDGGIALLCVNLDDFRTVNASVGKEAADRLLIAVAGRLVAATRPEDVVVRLGGDDFAVLVDSAPTAEIALGMAHRIIDAIGRPFSVGDVPVQLTASVGVALTEGAAVAAADLLRDADIALYMAKKAGKRQVELVRPGMRDEAMEHLSLVADLRRAVEAEEFEVYFQAIVDADDARPVGAEALARWRHPTRGVIGPGQFIPLAEAEGLIVPLGRWVLLQACQQAQQWIEAAVVGPHFYVSVNVSAIQLASGGILDDVAGALARSGLDPASLVLEVTESTLMRDMEAGRDRLRALSELGVRIALDDFGTGYSSFYRLRNLHVDVLKVDKSFVDHVTRSHEDVVLVQTVVTAGHGLGAVVVAEGVETAAQHQALKQLGCDAIQGYLFARPAPAPQALERITELAVAARQPARRPADYSSSG